jgi:hypothetical protein
MNKTLIIRKPKFMRNDEVMKTYLGVAATIGKEMTRSELTTDQLYELSKKIGECLNKAAKAGGFFSTADLIKYMNSQTTAN